MLLPVGLGGGKVGMNADLQAGGLRYVLAKVYQSRLRGARPGGHPSQDWLPHKQALASLAKLAKYVVS